MSTAVAPFPLMCRLLTEKGRQSEFGSKSEVGTLG